jgi:2-polyprenyl-3-methyl-5-hydroxy-6-metoxy-1,4-benzoquinol methylase
MADRVHYTSCPVCKSGEINPLLKVTDYTVSKEEYTVWQCGQCTLRFTQDVPSEASIGPYYKSPDYISHTNTSQGLVNKLYQSVRKYTLKQKSKFIADQTGIIGGKLLDVGCGTGAFLDVMKKEGWEVIGLEPDEEARELARKLYRLTVFESSQLNQLPSSGFDAITLWHVLEHVHDLHNYVEQLKNILKPAGKLFIAVPNYQSLDAQIYRRAWAAYDVPRHLYHFTPKSIEVLMKGHGLKVKAVQPMWFDAFYISMLSSKYRSGRVNYIASFINGLRSNTKALFNKKACSSLIYIIEKV